MWRRQVKESKKDSKKEIRQNDKILNEGCKERKKYKTERKGGVMVRSLG